MFCLFSGINKGDNANAQTVSAVITQATSATAASYSSTAVTHTVSSSSSLITAQALGGSRLAGGSKPVVHRVTNSLASSVAEVIIQSPVSTVLCTDGTSGSTKSITVDASPRGGATITSQMQSSVPITMVTNDKTALKRPLSSGSGNSGNSSHILTSKA